jgi:hypothetical protein
VNTIGGRNATEGDKATSISLVYRLKLLGSIYSSLTQYFYSVL